MPWQAVCLYAKHPFGPKLDMAEGNTHFEMAEGNTRFEMAEGNTRLVMHSCETFRRASMQTAYALVLYATTESRPPCLSPAAAQGDTQGPV